MGVDSEAGTQAFEANQDVRVSAEVQFEPFEPGSFLDPPGLDDKPRLQYIAEINKLVTQYGNYRLNFGIYPAGAVQRAILSALRNMEAIINGQKT